VHFSAFLTTRSGGPAEDRPVVQAMIEHTSDVERLGFDAVFLARSPLHRLCAARE
jgi:hypothetical protein